MSQQYICSNLVKLRPFLQEIWGRQAISKHSKTLCDLEKGSRPPKSNQFLSMAKQYSCVCLVKIHPFLQESGCRQAIFQQSKPSCDLENGVKVPKISSVLIHVPTIYLFKFGQKSINSFRRYGADMPFPNILKPCVTLKIRSISPKSIQFLSMSKQYSYASLVKIHPYLQETGCRQAIFQQSKPSCDLEMGSRSQKSNQHFSPTQCI